MFLIITAIFPHQPGKTKQKSLFIISGLLFLLLFPACLLGFYVQIENVHKSPYVI